RTLAGVREQPDAGGVQHRLSRREATPLERSAQGPPVNPGDRARRSAMPDAIVLAIRADRANAILDGTARFEHRTVPPKRLPARAFLAVVEEHAIVGECDLDPPSRRSAQGWALPVSRPRRYRTPRPLSDFGLAKIPRSFRYVEG